MITQLDSIQIFTWNESFETGIVSIDEQHKTLIYLLNSLFKTLMGYDKCKIEHAFDELAAYANYHFESEEAIWTSCLAGDELLSSHKSSHLSFLPKALEIQKKYSSKPQIEMTGHVIKFLIRWLTYHILNNDKHMASVVLYMQEGDTLEEAKDKANEEMKNYPHGLIEQLLKMYNDFSSRTLELLQEINERERIEVELQKLSRAVEHSSSSVIITDCESNIEYVNNKFTEITGYAKEEVLGQNPQFLQSGETPKEVYAEMFATITSGGEWRGEVSNRKKNGCTYWSRNSISGVKDAKDEITHFICIQEDVTHEHELSEQLSYQASHDSLTGLINRYEFERRAERLLSSRRQDEAEDEDEHALCYLDLDQFKIVNDTCGHTAGDELLRELSKVLQHEVRKRDTLARLGGDEFGVLMEHCSLKHAYRVATSLQKSIQNIRFTWEGHSFNVGVSIGLVAITKMTTNLTELLKQADATCYIAKDLGRNRIHVYESKDANLAQRHGEMQWVVRINRAIEDNRFCLYAQSIIPLDGSDGTHYELLIRMKDDDGEIIPPAAFLPAAERYNLMSQIDRWVVKNAFILLEEHPAFLKQIHFISINLSGHSLADDSFQSFVIKLIHDTGIDSEKICFEITETAAISNLSTAISFISVLKELGCKFALDDFGSGLSSFGYLKNLPVDYLKIDGVFVKDIINDPIDYAMVKSINEIGQVMGMQTIAEFVENDEIKAMLREIGVNYAQGYGIDKPTPFDEVLSKK